MTARSRAGTAQTWVALVALAVLFGGAQAIAQLTTGTINGAVTGPTGRYEFPSLPGGTYEVTATSQGFQTSIRSGVVLSVGQNLVVNHSLQVGEVTQSVTVTGEVPLVETTSATVSQLVDEKKIQDIPLNGRDLTQLAFLQPGVMKMPTGTGVFSGLGDKITVAGARGNQNLYLLDGVSNSDLSGNPQGAAGSYIGAETVKEFQVITNNYSAEYQSAAGAIVSAVTKSGTNTLHGSGFWTTRNSTFDANSWSNNRNNAGKRDFTRNQFGGSLGGPIIRDKMFFFGSYEGFRVRNNDAATMNTYTDAVRDGFIPCTEPSRSGITYLIPVPATANCTAANQGRVAVDPNVKAIMDLWPRPNTPYKYANDASFPIIRDLGTGAVTIQGEGLDRDPINDNFVGAKLDHMLSNEKLGTISAIFNWDRSDELPTSIASELGAGTPGTTSNKKTIGGKLTSIWSPTMVNEANFGYSYSESAGDIPITSQDFSSLASLTGRTLIGDIGAPVATNIGYRVTTSTYKQTAYQIKDGVSLTRGNHSMRFGVEDKLFRYFQSSCSRGCNGVWAWSNLTSFLVNIPLNLEIFQPGKDNPDRFMNQMLFGTYFQDNWQVMPSLTLNLGMRYEFTTVPKETNGLSSALINFNDPWVTVTKEVVADPRYAKDKFCSTPGVTPACASSGLIDGFFTNPTLKSFSPRVGFAWAPGSHKFSLRGGGGIFYEYPLLFNIRTVLQESPPFVQTGTVDTSSPQYAAFRAAGGPAITMKPGVGSDPQFVALLGSTPNIRAMEYNQKNVTIYRWSLTLQQDLGHGLVVSAGYTGSRGVHLWTQKSANVNRWVGWPNQPSGQKTFPIATTNRNAFCPAATTANVAACQTLPAGAYNPSFGIDMRIQAPMAASSFHGLAVGAQGRMGTALQYQLAFNWSKSIDTGSGVTSGGENFNQGQRGAYYWDMNLARGLSAFDIRKTLSSNFTYALPGQNLRGLLGAVVGGWETSGILTLTAGHPVSITDTPTVQRNAIGQSAENNYANLIAGGDHNPVLDNATPFNYYDATQFIPSICTGVPARISSIAGSTVPICAPGDAEYNPGHFGNSGRNTLISPGLATMDFSIQKNFNVTENHRIQFRAELFNFFNRVNLNEPGATPYSNSSIPDTAFWRTNGQITNAGSPRTMQFGLKYNF